MAVAIVKPVLNKRGRLAWTLASAAMLLTVLAPALWNGFPFIFPDTGGYLARPYEGTLELGRSALYGAFLAIGVPLDFWPNIIAQAALTIWLVVLTLRAQRLGDRPWLALAVVVALTATSAMPWYADTLMPDILLPAAVLSMYLLAFRGDALRLGERIALMAVVALAMASHMGTLALCLGLMFALVIARWLPLAWPHARLALAGSATAAGLLLAPLSNLAITGQFAFTPGGETFLFGRLVQDGIVARYLADRCPAPEIRLCAFKDKLPQSADEWLWSPGNPIGELGGWRAYRPEARRITLDTLRMYPGMHIATAARAIIDQFLLMKTEVSVNPDWNAPAIGALTVLVPQIMPRLNAARQQAAPFALDTLNLLHVAVAAISIIALAAILALPRRLPVAPPAVAMALTVLVALLGNAAICGIFSNPVDRYQSRLVWLAPLALAAAVLSRRRSEA
jgi:hypothetical protein